MLVSLDCVGEVRPSISALSLAVELSRDEAIQAAKDVLDRFEWTGYCEECAPNYRITSDAPRENDLPDEIPSHEPYSEDDLVKRGLSHESQKGRPRFRKTRNTAKSGTITWGRTLWRGSKVRHRRRPGNQQHDRHRFSSNSKSNSSIRGSSNAPKQ